MRRILICTGILGGGTALVFGAAAVTAALIPPSRIVPQGQGARFDRTMPANFAPAGPVRIMTVGGPDVSVELPTPEEPR